MLVLTRIDRIHPSHMPDRPGVGPSAAKMTKEALVAGWKKLLRADAIDRFAGSSSVCFGVDGWETVEAKLVTCFVTELGKLKDLPVFIGHHAWRKRDVKCLKLC